MSRYIDADEFWNNRPENLDPKKSEYNRGWDKYAKEILKVLEETPTADVVEVRHGEWINKCCSVCGEKQPYTARGNVFATTFYQFKTKYCPHCGAKMDGERK